MNEYTYLIKCKRVGKGFNVYIQYECNGIHTGSFMLDTKNANYSDINVSLSKYEYPENVNVFAVYLYNLTAPGEFCQIMWVSNDISKREKIQSIKSDICGDYIHNTKLSDLTQDQIKHYYNTIIRE